MRKAAKSFDDDGMTSRIIEGIDQKLVHVLGLGVFGRELLEFRDALVLHGHIFRMHQRHEDEVSFNRREQAIFTIGQTLQRLCQSERILCK